MTVAKALAPVAIIAVAVVGAYLLFALRPRIAPRTVEDTRPPVQVLALTQGPVGLRIEASGTVAARGRQALSSEVGGRVAWVSPRLEPSATVAAGDELARIDPDDHAAAVERARARLAASALALAQEEALAAQAEREWSRLGDGDGDGAPLARREPHLAAARSALAADRAGIAEAERDLAACSIRAPYAARIEERLVELGMLLAPGAAVARLHAADAVEIALPVRDADLEHLGIAADFDEVTAGRPGPTATLTASLAIGSHAWSGRIVRAGATIDPQTRLVTLICRVESPFVGHPLLPGAFVHAVIAGRTEDAAVMVPRWALREDGTVLLVDTTGRLLAHRATVLQRRRDDVVVAADLPAGARLLATRLERLTPGTEVRVLELSAERSP